MSALLLAATLSVAPMTGSSSSFADSTQVYFAQKNVEALKKMLKTSETREASLLCRYRLYPLTEDETYLEDLPEDLPDGSARALALLSGLWAYRTAEASVFGTIRYGRRAARLLDQARRLNPHDPYVLLIGGQSLLFRPAFAGGDPRKALDRFQTLYRVVHSADDAGIPPVEADLWTWYALKRLGDDNAGELRRRLTTRDLPPLYREFLKHPPG